MNIRVKYGCKLWDDLKEKIRDYSELPVSVDYVDKYRKLWKTAEIKPKSNFKIKVSDYSGRNLMNFVGVDEEINMVCGGWISPVSEGKKYVFGRDDEYIGSGLFESYYLSIKEDGDKIDKRRPGIPVSNTISRIHMTSGYDGNRIIIGRIGISDLVIEAQEIGEEANQIIL